jgi:hypothetical protein
MAPPPAPPPPPPAPPPAAATTVPPYSPAFAPAQPAFKIETPNKSNVKIGLLLQPQFQALNDANPAISGYGYNLYLRRTRFLLGGTLFGVLDYFFETDFANLFLPVVTPPNAMTMAPGTAVKATPGMNIQDAFVTYKPLGDLVKIDMGYMLPPLAHNAVQGATTLYSWDYFANTFLSTSTATGFFGANGNPVGRDLGIEARGLLLDGHIEYRAGLFQGRRIEPTTTEIAARNFFRFSARLQINLLEPETGFFYAGTYLGAKKILSLGGAIDIQDEYKYFAGDAFVDLPLGPGVLTGQINFAYWNGGTWFPMLVKQSALMGEVGYSIAAAHIAPIFRAEELWVDGAAPNTTRLGGGIAFWPFGHNSNVKAFYTNIKVQNATKSANQFNVQWQLYFF